MRIDAGAIEVVIQLSKQFGIEEVLDLFGTLVEVAFAEYEVFREERFPQPMRTDQFASRLSADVRQMHVRAGADQPAATDQQPSGEPRDPRLRGDLP